MEGKILSLTVVAGSMAGPLITSDTEIEMDGMIPAHARLEIPGTATTQCGLAPMVAFPLDGATLEETKRQAMASQAGNLQCVRRSPDGRLSVMGDSSIEGIDLPREAAALAADVDLVFEQLSRR